MTTLDDKRALMRDLIDFRGDPLRLAHRLEAVPTEEEPEVTLTRADMRARLGDYLAGRRSTDELATWAFMVFGRDEILRQDDSPALALAFMSLFKNRFEGALPPHLAAEWIAALDAEESQGN